MDFVFEFFVELLSEVFLENGIEAASNRHFPKWLRILILAATAVIFVAVFGIILLAGTDALSHTPLMSLLMFALDAGLVFFCACKVRKVLRAHPPQ